jgi:hypothetical protein
MNPVLVPTVLATAAFFAFGLWVSPRLNSSGLKILLLVTGIISALPALLFVVYYTGVLGEVKWFYTYRSWPYTELTAAGAGLIAGWLQAWRNQNQHFRKYLSAGFIPFILLLVVAIPYLKQIVLRPDWNSYNDNWLEGVCLQSSESSCGPASAATLLHLAGKPATEKEIALESFTSRRGTENWYLVRTMRRHGLVVNYLINRDRLDLPFPAIVGVRLGGKTGPGHFIAILGKAGDGYVVGDPLEGRKELDASQLRDRYYFTGFAIVADLPNH